MFNLAIKHLSTYISQLQLHYLVLLLIRSRVAGAAALAEKTRQPKLELYINCTLVQMQTGYGRVYYSLKKIVKNNTCDCSSRFADF